MLIPKSDPFSFTFASKPWIAHEWLSELFIFGIFKLGGFSLLILIFSVVITATFLFSYLRSPEISKPYLAGFAVLLGAITSLPIWGVRPQMFNLFFISIFLLLLDSLRRSNNIKWLIPIPLITILWVNMHAGFILGITIEIIYIFGFLFETVLNKYHKKEKISKTTQRSFWILVCVLGASIFAALINPTGFRILAYPFQTLTDSSMQTYISEWFSPDFHQVIWQPFAFLILILIGAGMIGIQPISITKVLLTLVFGYGALRSIRNIPLFAVVIIPVLAEQLSPLTKFIPDEQKESHHFRYIASIALLALIIILSLGFFQVTNNIERSEAETFPKDAVTWIMENDPKGNLFNSYNWGGYIIWKLSPDHPVYIDGRADLYGKEFVLRYTEIYFAKPGWEEKLDQENIGIVFVETDAMIADALRQSSSWVKSYEDKISVIFLRK